MKKLEQDPKTYDEKFTALTDGINLKVQDWIIEHIKNSENILEIGCGTGILSKKMALKGNNVLAIDKNINMINYALKNFPTNLKVNLLYQTGSFLDFSFQNNSRDTIVSTFLLSELGPFQQQIFLRRMWKILKPGGKLIIAAEFVPKGIFKVFFKLKRWWYKRKLHQVHLKETVNIKWFFKYIKPIGFKIITHKKYAHGAIQILELQKKVMSNNIPGYYNPKPKIFKGLIATLRILRCILTGQIDHVQIEPGIYKSGKPDENSPIIVTSNYEYTYIKVLRDLYGIDAWVLCIDSGGINVWCAARGGHFGNEQLLEAIQATDLTSWTKRKSLILPQLAAGGVSKPNIPENTKNFPFEIKYGPIWSKYLPEYLENRPKSKPDYMKIAKFNITHRFIAGISHLTFLLRKIFLLPIIALFMVIPILNFIFNITWFIKLWFPGEILIWIFLANLIIIILFPLSNFTRKFIVKGSFFGCLNVLILFIISLLLHGNILYSIFSTPFYFWVSFFTTMSFSGYTMSTNPSEIQNEYSTFNLINIILLIISIIFLGYGIIIF